MSPVLLPSQDYDTGLFSSFLASEAGRLQFSTSRDSVTIQGSSCPVTSGCVCGNDDEILVSSSTPAVELTVSIQQWPVSTEAPT